MYKRQFEDCPYSYKFSYTRQFLKKNNMPLVKVLINENESEFEIHVNEGTILRDALLNNDIPLYSPCGGKGTCNKCRVNILEEGYVLSCLYVINKNINVVVPAEREADILVAQHNYMLDLPFLPDRSVHLSTRPVGVAIDLGRCV